MLLKLLFLFLLCSQLLQAQQDYHRLNLLADNLVAYKKYKQAVALYELLETASYPFDKVKAAKAYACTQQPQKAITLLHYASPMQLWEIKPFFDTTAIASLEAWHTIKENLYYRWQIEIQHQLVHHISPLLLGRALIHNRENLNGSSKKLPANPSMIPFRISKNQPPYTVAWGFVSPTNRKKWLIKPTFSTFGSLHQLGAVVGNLLEEQEQKYIYGLIGADGNFKIPMEYTSITKEGKWFHALKIKWRKTLPAHHYSPYLPKKWLDGGVYFQHDYYNEAGQLVFTETSVDFQSFNTNRALAWFRKGTQISIRDQEGKRIQQLETTDAARVFSGISNQFINYKEQQGDSLYIRAYDQADQLQHQLFLSEVDSSGLVFSYQQPQACYALSEQMYLLDKNKEGKIILVDTKTGREYTHYSYDPIWRYTPDYSQQPAFWVHPSDSPKIAATHSHLLYLLDRKGHTLLTSRGAHAGFVEGFLFLSTGRGYLQIMDILGESQFFQDIYVVGKYYYELPYGFNEQWGVAEKVCQDSISGSSYNCIYYFDTTGTTTLLLDSSITDAAPFSDGLALAKNKDGKFGYIDKKGHWAIPPIYDWKFHSSTPYYFHFYNGYAYWPDLGYINKQGQEFFSQK